MFALLILGLPTYLNYTMVLFTIYIACIILLTVTPVITVIGPTNENHNSNNNNNNLKCDVNNSLTTIIIIAIVIIVTWTVKKITERVTVILKITAISSNNDICKRGTQG